MTEVLDGRASPRHAPTDSGVLARVPGQYIAQASKSLPDPACALDDEMTVEIDAERVGRVRLTFRRQRYNRPLGKVSYFSWLCRHAENVADPSTQDLPGSRHILKCPSETSP
ncbi:hypothetical protein [Roseateles sp. LYH14W]|uniref:Uncharacterized protein n=1 Tax=Pelomonas parva TaxID=3299032 RepID=A0ABW7EZU2_9BURK